MRIWTQAIVGGFVLVLLTADARAQRGRPIRPANREGNLKVGDAAPGFTVKDMHGKKTVTLSELKGKPVVLFFGSCT